MQLLEELNNSGITIVMVTHDLNMARHARRIVHMNDGQLISDELSEGRVSPKVGLLKSDRTSD
jgi:macrolide transport system ATP-binding/permease protein